MERQSFSISLEEGQQVGGLRILHDVQNDNEGKYSTAPDRDCRASAGFRTYQIHLCSSLKREDEAVSEKHFSRRSEGYGFFTVFRMTMGGNHCEHGLAGD